MPEGLAEAMTPPQRRDLIRFLLELGHSADEDATIRSGDMSTPRPRSLRSQAAAAGALAPLGTSGQPRPRLRLLRQGGRVLPQAARPSPRSCPPSPGSTAASTATGATRTKTTWADGRWNQTDLGRCMSGVFQGEGRDRPQGVCVRLGERGEMAACFNPETLCYEALWQGGFVKFSPTRHGFLDGLIMDGTPLPRPEGKAARTAVRVPRLLPPREARRLRLPDRRDRDARRPLGRGRQVHADRRPGRGPPARRPRRAAARRNGRRSSRPEGSWAETRPYAVDTIEPPFHNPWNALDVLRRPRLLPRRHGHDLHDAGRRLAGRGARRRPGPRCAGGGSPRACIRPSAW